MIRRASAWYVPPVLADRVGFVTLVPMRAACVAVLALFTICPGTGAFAQHERYQGQDEVERDQPNDDEEYNDDEARYRPQEESQLPIQARIRRPRTASAPVARLRSVLLRDAAHALRPSVAALRALGRSRAHRYEQRAVRGARGLSAENFVLAMVRTWGRPSRLDQSWFERATEVPASGPHTLPTDQGSLSPYDPSTAATAEVAALRQIAAALRDLAEAQPSLLFFHADGGWADENGGRAVGIAIVDPRAHECLWIYLSESWRA